MFSEEGRALNTALLVPSGLVAIWKLLILLVLVLRVSSWLVRLLSSSSWPRSRTTGIGLPRTYQFNNTHTRLELPVLFGPDLTFQNVQIRFRVRIQAV